MKTNHKGKMMLPINDPRVKNTEKGFVAICNCGAACSFASKNGALKMLQRGNCRRCKKDYRSVNDTECKIHQNTAGKWCSFCSGCGKEQAYTRKDHAKQSSVADWLCKQCVAKNKGFSENHPVGNEKRLYNKFKKSANTRGIEWTISYQDFVGCFTGKCALSGWPLSMTYSNCTASFDRIDSSKGYQVDNTQWVHVMVNMCKNKYSQDKFLEMCRAVALHKKR